MIIATLKLLPGGDTSLSATEGAHGVDHAAELGDESVARAVDHAAAMKGNSRVCEVTAQRTEPGKDALFVGAGQPGISGAAEMT